MRIDKSASIAGLPAKAVRAFLRTWARDDLYIKHGASTLGEIQNIQEVLSELVRLELLKKLPDVVLDAEPYDAYRRTIKGNAFAQASTGPGFKRSTAANAVDTFLARAAETNVNDFLIGVSRVGVFGSYTGDAEVVNDVDLCVEFYRKYHERDWMALSKERVSFAKRQGRRFSSFEDELYWPDVEVRLFLQGRSRIINIHGFEDALGIGAAVTIIYDAGIDLEPEERGYVRRQRPPK